MKYLPVVGYENYYEVSSNGIVRSVEREILYKNGDVRLHKSFVLSQKNKSGRYPKVGLWKNNKVKYVSVHVLMLESFIGPRPSKQHEGCHRDDNQNNNDLSNLYWGTKKQNTEDRIRNNPLKNYCSNGHLYIDSSIMKQKDGSRKCRACHYARQIVKRKPELEFIKVANDYYGGF